MRVGPALLPLVALLACARTAPPAGQGYVPPDPETSDDTGPTGTAGTLRVATWNVEGLGSPGSAEHEAVAAILARIDADVVGLNELDELEEAALADLAEGLGYEVVVAEDNPFGELHNAVLSRLPPITSTVWTSVLLSGDTAANDLTRLPVSVEVDVGGVRVALTVNHWKSGFDDEDEFRRAVDNLRTAQAAEVLGLEHGVVVGDLNAELDDGPGSPAAFTALPAGVPSSYALGDDLSASLSAGGIANEVFPALLALGLEPADALQRDGREATRDESGRRLDYVLAGPGLAVEGAEVYDSRDDALDGLPLAGTAPEHDASLTASDHFPVLVDLRVGG